MRSEVSPATKPPFSAEEYVRLAAEYLEMRRIEESLACSERAIQLGADPLSVSYQRWMCFMLRGDLESAWRETDLTEAARRSANSTQSHLPLHLRRVWDGSSLEGKRVLVRCYHGLGDTIQFVRYIPLLRMRAAWIVVQCQRRLAPLLQSLREIDELFFLEDGEVDAESDVQIELMELAYAFRTTLETIPCRVPYLRVSQVAFTEASCRCSAGALRIGLAWSSGDWNRARNIRLAQLADLGRSNETRDIAFYSLQRGDAAREILGCPHLRILDRERECKSITDTAATIAHMDLVISVDTMVAHLAGALGRPVWLLLPFCADWRWMLGRNDSPWYPAMRLFRQKSPGEWQPVVEEVSAALARP